MTEKIIFEMQVPQGIKLTKDQVEVALQDLSCLGVSEQKIEQIPSGFLLMFNRQEWMDSWEGVGFPLKEGAEAEAFEQELKGSWLADFEGYEKIKIVRKQTTTGMRYFRARRYVHASQDGLKTLCGVQCNTFGCHWETELWREVEKTDFDYSSCPKCRKKSKQFHHISGRQITLKETTS